MDKYKLPAVDSLEEIGFTFEYARLKDAMPSIRKFVDTRTDELALIYFPDHPVYDDEGNTIDIIRWGAPEAISNKIEDEPEKEMVARIDRIEKGTLKITDHILLVHPKYRKDKDIILKALRKKLRGIYGATGFLVHKGNIWNLSLDDSVLECLYHKVLDDLIFKIADEGLINSAKWNPVYGKYKEKKAKAEKYKADNPGRSLSTLGLYWEADKELMSLSNDMFSENMTLEKNASIIIRKALMKGPILADIYKKEKTILYYLKLQSKLVKKGKDNSKSNKGIQKGKRESVINLYKSDPGKSITEIVSELSPKIKITRKTASKYIREFKNG